MNNVDITEAIKRMAYKRLAKGISKDLVIEYLEELSVTTWKYNHNIKASIYELIKEITMSTKDQITVHDDILQGITFEDLITTLQSNEPIIDETTVRRVYNEILRKQQEDARHMLITNMEFILRKAGK